MYSCISYVAWGFKYIGHDGQASRMMIGDDYAVWYVTTATGAKLLT